MSAPRFIGARDADMPFIADTIARLKLDAERLAPAQFILLQVDSRTVGFGRIKPYPELYELGSVAVLESERGHGYGRLIVEELIRRFPSDEIWITTDLPDYFARFGFARTDQVPPVLADKLSRICNQLRTGAVAMRFDRTAANSLGRT